MAHDKRNKGAKIFRDIEEEARDRSMDVYTYIRIGGGVRERVRERERDMEKFDVFFHSFLYITQELGIHMWAERERKIYKEAGV